MIEFGKTLKLAREAKGLTVDDVAEITHIMPRTIENLEKENFSDIVAPIYGRGFVKLYCEAVGIDYRPLVDEFMEIFNGNREAVIAERPVATVDRPQTQEMPEAESPEPAPEFPEAITASEPPLRGNAEVFTGGDDLFSANTPFTPQPDIAAGNASPTLQTHGEEPPPAGLPPPKPSAGANFSRYASPFDSSEEPKSFRFQMPAIPPAVWRIGVLVAVAAALLWALLSGIRALYRTTMPTAAETAIDSTAVAPVKTEAPENVGDAAKKAEPRKPVDIPQLYID
jgi:transcriptional regulator with XRE-family HTH domain